MSSERRYDWRVFGEKKLTLREQKQLRGILEKSEIDYVELLDLVSLNDGVQLHSEALRALYKLVKKVLPLASEVSAVVSDDSSGRLVALLLCSVINEARTKEGLLPVRVHSIDTGRDDPTVTSEFIRKNKETLQHALIASEIVIGGETAEKLFSLFAREGLSPRIAALSVISMKELSPDNRKRVLFGGSSSSGGILFWRARQLGIRRGEQKTHFPSAIRRFFKKGTEVPAELSETQKEDSKKIQEQITAGRKQVHILSTVFTHFAMKEIDRTTQ